MPYYDYECENCNRIFELRQKITEEPIERCIYCDSPRVKRLIGTGVKVIFKGNGFYETDYKKTESSDSDK